MKQHIHLIHGFLGILLLATAPASAQEDPNIIRENGRTFYVVQEGDTLWDISQKFLDSPDYWPDLWKVNSDVPITNPHLIYPGQRLRLYRKGEMPPEAAARAPESPPASPSPPPPAAPVPPAETPEVLDIDGDRRLKTFRFSTMEKTGFIRVDPEPPQAVIIRAADRREMISFDDRVYLRESEDAPLDIGKFYTIYRTVGPIVDQISNEPVGIQHIPTGVLEVEEKKSDYTIATVVRAYRDIRMEDKVMPFMKRSTDLTLTAGRPGLDGKIITSEERNWIYGEYDVVFINRGENDGVSPGQEYTVFVEEQEPISPDSPKKLTISPIDIGQLVVLHTEPTTATAVITRSTRTIRPGARLRAEE
ncbi:MAG: LysM peptidoglycan-binding domain-containing protein [Desulfococcaceae bacterium]